MGKLTLFGDITPKAVIYKIESHKLMHGFPLKDGEKIKTGQLVVLNTDGTVQAFKSSDSLRRVVGVATVGSDSPAYKESMQHGPVDVTVSTKGYAIVYGVAAADINAGPVKPNGSLDTTSKYAAYVQATEPTAGNASSNPVVFPTPGDQVTAFALNSADTGELVQVLLLV